MEKFAVLDLTFSALFSALFSAPGLLLAAFLGALIQRVAGMGFGIAVSGFTLAAFDPFTAVYVSAIIGFGVTVVTTLQVRQHIVWPVVWPIVMPIMIAMFAGFGLAYAFGHLPLVRAGFQTLGLIAIALALQTLLNRHQAKGRAWIAHPWVGGSFTGFMSGTVGMPGPTIAPYFAAHSIVGTVFVASITPVFILTSLSRFTLGSGSGFGAETLYIALIGAMIATLGVFVGGWIAPYVPLKVQQRLILLIIFASAARLAYALVEGLVLSYIALL